MTNHQENMDTQNIQKQSLEANASTANAQDTPLSVFNETVEATFAENNALLEEKNYIFSPSGASIDYQDLKSLVKKWLAANIGDTTKYNKIDAEFKTTLQALDLMNETKHSPIKTYYDSENNKNSLVFDYTAIKRWLIVTKGLSTIDGELYQYNGVSYEIVPDLNELEYEISHQVELLTSAFSGKNGLRRSYLKEWRPEVPKKTVTPGDYTAFKNGIVDFTNRNNVRFITDEETKQKLVITNSFPEMNFDPKALEKGAIAPTIWNEYTKFMFGENAYALTVLVGNIMEFNYQHNQIVGIVSGGGTGKSTYFNSLFKPFQKSNRFDSSGLDVLFPDRQSGPNFNIANLINKAISFDDDASKKTFDTTMMKKVTGNSLISANRKNQPIAYFKNYAKIFYLSNEGLSRFITDSGIARRVILIKAIAPSLYDEGKTYANPEKLAERKKQFPDKILDEQVESFLSFAFYQNILADGQWNVQNNQSDLLKRTDYVGEFINTMLVHQPGAGKGIDFNFVYELYRLYIKEEGAPYPLAKPDLQVLLKQKDISTYNNSARANKSDQRLIEDTCLTFFGMTPNGGKRMYKRLEDYTLSERGWEAACDWSKKYDYHNRLIEEEDYSMHKEDVTHALQENGQFSPFEDDE